MKLVGPIILFVLFFEAASVEATSDIIVSYREVHMDTTLSCNEPIINRKWYFYTEPDSTAFQPITAENGSHYEINENIAGLKIIRTVEADEGYYLVQGNGGMKCRFQLNVYGLFSYNSGDKVSGTGNYEDTLYGVEGYAVTIPCDYNITEVSGAEDTFVNVDAVVNNVNVMDCEKETYPYCTSCEACFPLLNNPFRQFVLFPNKGSASSMLRCRVNLGTPYNGKTVDKQITVITREVTSETVALPYNMPYQLCSNASGDWNGVISTTMFSGGIPTNQMEYSANNLPIIVLVNYIEVSCQNLDSMGFPIADQIYRYDITIIADLPNERETITESTCEEEISKDLTFNCSYQIIGPSQLKETVEWELNGIDCSSDECTVSGEYSQISLIRLQDLSPYKESNIVRCSVVISDLTYFREWSIVFEECPSGMTLTPTMVPINTTPPTQQNMTVIPTTEPLESGILAGIISGAILCVIFVAILVALLVVAVLLYFYRWLPDRSYKTNSNSRGHDSQKFRYTKPDLNNERTI